MTMSTLIFSMKINKKKEVVSCAMRNDFKTKDNAN